MPGQERPQEKVSEKVTPRVPGTSLCVFDDVLGLHPQVPGQTLLSLSFLFAEPKCVRSVCGQLLSRLTKPGA